MKAKSKIANYLLSMGLKKKVILTITGSILFLGFTLAGFVHNNEIKTLSHMLRNEGVIITRNLVISSEDPILTDDIVGLHRHLRDIVRVDKNVSYVHILDPKGYVIAHTFNKGVPAGFANINPVADDTEYSAKLILTEDGYIRDISMSIGGLGEIHVGMSENNIRGEAKRLTWALLVLTLAITLLGIIIASSIVAWEMKPLELLAMGVREIASGNLDYNLDVDVTDEIGQLAGEFNKMAGDIKASRDKLQKWNEELERRVIERTVELIESESKIRAITDSAQDAIIMMDDNGMMVYWNEAAHDIFGYKREEALGVNAIALLIPERFHEEHTQTLRALKKSDMNDVLRRTMEYVAVKKSGEEIPVEISSSSVKIKESSNIIWIVRDITKRKAAEHEVTKAHNNQLVLDELLRVSFERTPLKSKLELSLEILFSISWLNTLSQGAIFLVGDDPNVLILEVAKGFAEESVKCCSSIKFGECLCGRTAVDGKISFSARITPEHEKKYSNIAPHGNYTIPILSEEKVIGIINLNLEEGHKYDYNEVIFLESVGNTMSALIKRAQVEDEKDRLWYQLLQSQKLETIGKLTGEMVHDFNNILTSIIGFSNMAMNKLPLEHPVKKIIERVYNIGKKAAVFVNKLLIFSRKQVLDMKVCSLNDIVENVKDILTGLLGDGVTLNIYTNPNVKNVMADESQIEHALINIVVNASAAMSKGGNLTIKTQNAFFDGKSVIEHQGNIIGQYAVISVRDTGVGMDKEVQSRIFEPFYTTKEKGKGTGLGLSTVFGVVKQHNGFIMVDSEPGKGAKFKIYLPVTEEKVNVVPMKEVLSVEDGNETILVVEDDDAVRELMMSIIEPKGYKVLLAENATEALKIIYDVGEKVDLLLTDVIMHSINGWDLYIEVKKRIHDIKVIFISGYVNTPVIINNIMENNMPFISKPLIPNVLLAKIREVLDKDIAAGEEKLSK